VKIIVFIFLVLFLHYKNVIIYKVKQYAELRILKTKGSIINTEPLVKLTTIFRDIYFFFKAAYLYIYDINTKILTTPIIEIVNIEITKKQNPLKQIYLRSCSGNSLYSLIICGIDFLKP